MSGSETILFPGAGGWWLLAICALFLPALWLRRRKRSVRITTYFLLRDTVEHLARLSPRVSLKRRLGALFFLAAALLLAICGFRPLYSSGRRPLRELAIVDLAASLGVVEAGRPRLDMFRARVRDYVRLLQREDRLSLVLAGAVPSPRALLAGGPQLERLVEELDYQDAPTDVPAAMDQVRAFLAEGPFDHVIVFTDAPARWREAFEAKEFRQLAPHWSGSGEAVANVGITAFDVQGDFLTAGLFHAYVGVDSHGAGGTAQPFTGALVISNNGSVVRRLPLESRAGERLGVVVRDLPLEPGRVEAVLEPEDAYAADNRVAAGVAEGKRVRVFLVTAANRFLREALSANPALDLRVIDPGDPLPADPEAVVVFDGAVPEGPLPERALFIQPNRDLAGLVSRAYLPPPAQISWDRTDPVMQGVDLEGLSPKGYMSLERSGMYRELAAADGRPLILIGAEERRRWAVLAFDPSQTTFVYTASYPVLVTNLVRWLSLLTGGTRPWFSPGDPVFLPAAAAGGFVEHDPGRRTALLQNGRPVRTFAGQHPGRFQVVSPEGRQLGDFYVNVLDPEVTASVAKAGAPTWETRLPDGLDRGPLRAELLPGLLLLALGLLAAERLVQPPHVSGRE